MAIASTRMTLRQLQIFVAVAAWGSTTGASGDLALSQSATSAALIELEAVLGTPLFDRVGRRLSLNDAGRTLLPQARQLLESAQALEERFVAWDAGASFSLQIAASTTIGNYILPASMASFLRTRTEGRIELRDALFASAKGRQFITKGLPPGEHIVERRTMLAFEPFERGQTIFDDLQPLRRAVQIIGIRTQEQREILERGLHGVPLGQIRAEARIERRQFGDALPDNGQACKRRRFSVVQRRIGFRRQSRQPIRVRQHGAFGYERLVFAGTRIDLVDLLQLERRHLDANALLAVVERGAIERLRGVTPCVERASRCLGQRWRSEKRVEMSQVLDGIQEGLMLVLTMQRDELQAQFFQCGGRHERVVDERATPPAGRDFAPHDDLGAATALEHGVNTRRVFARTDEIGTGAAARQQADRFDEHGFAGPGFAGQQVEAGVELHLELIDYREMTHT